MKLRKCTVEINALGKSPIEFCKKLHLDWLFWKYRINEMIFTLFNLQKQSWIFFFFILMYSFVHTVNSFAFHHLGSFYETYVFMDQGTRGFYNFFFVLFPENTILSYLFHPKRCGKQTTLSHNEKCFSIPSIALNWWIFYRVLHLSFFPLIIFIDSVGLLRLTAYCSSISRFLLIVFFLSTFIPLLYCWWWTRFVSKRSIIVNDYVYFPSQFN